MIPLPSVALAAACLIVLIIGILVRRGWGLTLTVPAIILIAAWLVLDAAIIVIPGVN